MAWDSIQKFIPNLFRILSIAVILGFAFGLFFAILQIYKNAYLSYKTYNIILFDLKSYITEYVLFFIVLSAGAILIYIIIAGIFHDKSLKEHYLRRAASYSLGLIFLLAVILYILYPGIISFLKSTPLAESLHKLTKSKEETLWIFIFIASAVGLLFFIVSTYLLSKFKIADNIQSWLIKTADSRATKFLGFVLLAVVLILNIFVYGYKNANSPSGPNILLISIDTLRADHLGTYGHYRDTSPNIDKIADKGILFENAYSQGPWTYPSMASMHTSLYPSQLGINDFRNKIHRSHMTLAEYLKNNFYNTYAVISNVVVSKALGFSQGFNIFDQDSLREKDELTSHLVSDRAIEYLSESKGDKFFLWLHYMDPHHDYIDHPEYNYSEGYSGSLGDMISTQYLNKKKNSLDEEDLVHIKNLYDEEISFTDYHIGRVLDKLNELGLSDNTIVILTADHGEEFLERTRFGHGQSLYQEIINVPLIIYVPSNIEIGPNRVKSSVEIRSIARTILDLCGIRGNRIQGKNLLIIAEDDDTLSYAFSQKLKKREQSLETIIRGSWKLIVDLDINSYQLYELESDPVEKTNLVDSDDVDETIIKDLISKSSEIEKDSIYESVEVDFNEEDIQKLKALGYIQ